MSTISKRTGKPILRVGGKVLVKDADNHVTVQDPAPLPSPWMPIAKGSLPPNWEGAWLGFSQPVWLALRDGRVVMGNCLHRPRNATYRALVHDWFINTPAHPQGEQYGRTPLAWALIEAPRHPKEGEQS